MAVAKAEGFARLVNKEPHVNCLRDNVDEAARELLLLCDIQGVHIIGAKCATVEY